MRLYGLLVLRWCRRSGLAEHDAQDVCRDVFVSVAKGLTSFRKDRQGDTFRGWLRTITRNKLADRARRGSGVPDAVGGSDHLHRVASMIDPEEARDDEMASDDMILSRETSIARRALEFIREEFEERSWRAFWRTAIDAQKATDIAIELEMSPAAVRKAKSRVLSRLRSELEELVDFE